MAGRAHLTAITRTALSRPIRYLLERGRLKGRVLDYGCGRGFDADELNLIGWDPHWRPQRPRGPFDTVVCSFVLNVLDALERRTVLEDVQLYLKPGGVAYFTVRRDAGLKGWTSRLTWQEWVDLDLPVLYENAAFAIYYMEQVQEVAA